MITLPISRDSEEGRALLALRAGPMTAAEAAERWPTRGAAGFNVLCRARLAEKVGDEYRLTPAGRAACPFRNDILAGNHKPATLPEDSEMPQGKTSITIKEVINVIVAAGPAGIRRGALIQQLAVPHGLDDAAIDMHLTKLSRLQPPAIVRPVKGLVVAAQFAESAMPDAAPAAADPSFAESLQTLKDAVTTDPAGATPVEIAPETPSTAAADSELLEFDLEEAHAAPDLRDEELARQGQVIVDLHAKIDEITAQLNFASGANCALHWRVEWLEKRLAESGGTLDAKRYAIAFESDFHDTADSAVAQAAECYDSDTLKQAIVIACSPIGNIRMRHAFVPLEAA